MRTGVPDGMSIQRLVRVCETEYSPKKSKNICAKHMLARDGQMTDMCFNTYKSQKKVGARMGGKSKHSQQTEIQR